MPLSSGPRKHGVVSPEVVGAVEAFFSADDGEGVWLGGGTCLAEYYFGHRVSMDVDLFTADDDRFRDVRRTLERGDVFAALGDTETVRTDLHLSQFLLRCRSGTVVKVDLVRDLPVVLGPKVRCGPVRLDSLPDLAANKMGCLLHREDVKDYVDLYFLLPHLGLTAGQAVALGLEKDAGIDPLILAAQMKFVQSRPRPDFLRTDVPWENVKDYFRTLREDVLRLVEPRSP